MSYRKKLIEVALPREAVDKHLSDSPNCGRQTARRC
jgi:hypothetical protein